MNKNSDDRGRPGFRDYAVILALIAAVTFVALIVLGGQATKVLSITSGTV